MINLAGQPPERVDFECRRELYRARIHVEDTARSPGEVCAAVRGRIGDIVLTRAWRYWVAEGPVPLVIARALYDDPIGREDVRVAGHCGCPPPEFPWIQHRDADGKKLRPLTSEATDTRFRDDANGLLAKISAEIMATTRWVADPEAEAARSFVDAYHIDTEAGLRLFADVLRARNP